MFARASASCNVLTPTILGDIGMRHDHGPFSDISAAILLPWTKPRMTAGRLTDAELAEARRGPIAVASLVSRLRAQGRV